MFFHSPTALFLFLPIVFFLYPILQFNSYFFSRLFLLVFSLTFYGFDHPWFLAPLLLSASIDYLISKKMLSENFNKRNKNLLISISLIINLGLLIFFKYIPFIEESVSFLSLGSSFTLPAQFKFIMPAGISFYTFQTLSFVFDVYKGKVKALPYPIDYFLYVCYFPQLVAGPILRPSDFFDSKSIIKLKSSNSLIYSGFRRICFGLFLKLCLADELARLNDLAFSGDYNFISMIDAWTIAFGFGLQIYFDFSAYSHMAIGISEIIGLPIRENFNFPYMSRSSTEFWRRWHISLSSWVGDYLYSFLNLKLPLWLYGALPLLLTWTIMGLWHGASWRFAFWGLINGLFILFHRIYKTYLKEFAFLKNFSSPIFSWSITLFSTMATWIYFRAESWDQANSIFFKLWTGDVKLNLRENYYLFVFIFSFFTIFFGLIWQKRNSVKISKLFRNKLSSFVVCVLCLFFSSLFIERQVAFVYFQF